MSRTGQLAIAGKLTAGSPLGAMISSHVAGALDEPLIVLLEQDRADDDGVLGEGADHLGSPLLRQPTSL